MKRSPPAAGDETLSAADRPICLERVRRAAVSAGLRVDGSAKPAPLAERTPGSAILGPQRHRRPATIFYGQRYAHNSRCSTAWNDRPHPSGPSILSNLRPRIVRLTTKLFWINTGPLHNLTSR